MLEGDHISIFYVIPVLDLGITAVAVCSSHECHKCKRLTFLRDLLQYNGKLKLSSIFY